MNTIKMNLPANWLTALFNDDLSGYSVFDLRPLDLFKEYMLENYGNAIPIDYDLGSANFTAWHDARQFGVLGCTACTVTFPVTKQEEA